MAQLDADQDRSEAATPEHLCETGEEALLPIKWSIEWRRNFELYREYHARRQNHRPLATHCCYMHYVTWVEDFRDKVMGIDWPRCGGLTP